MPWQELLNFLVSEIMQIDRPHVVRVGIDGVDASGKTRLADALIPLIQSRGRPVIRASIDGFHQPRKVRYRNGRFSAEGYFNDSFDFAAVHRQLLQPLGPGGTQVYQRAVFDYRTDASLTLSPETAVSKSILLFDGVFLHRPELRSLWEFTIYLDVSFQVSVTRMVERDSLVPDSDQLLINRYVGGQKQYIKTCRPRELADIVIDNNDWTRPKIIKDMQTAVPNRPG
jgi:uridine kinase